MSIMNKPNHQTKKSMAQQHFERECNINTIMSRYRSTGILGDPTKLPRQQAQFRDISQNPSFVEAFNLVKDAGEGFRALPAAIRARFNGNPVQLLQFLNNINNRQEAIDMGLLPPDMLKKPTQTPLESTLKPDDDEIIETTTIRRKKGGDKKLDQTPLSL